MSSFDTSHMNSELLLRCNSVHILYSIAFCHFNLVFLTAGDAVRPIALNFAWAERHCHACKTPRSMYPSIYNSCPVIRTTNYCKKSPFLRTPAFIICLPWGRPGGNHAWNVAWMKRQFRAWQTLAPCTHLSSTVSQLFEPQVQKSTFSRTAANIFVFPGDAHAIITHYVARMERQFNACQTHRNMYLSIFNSFRVIQCLSQCVSPSLFLPHFCFPGDAPGAITLIIVSTEREFDAYKLSRCMCHLTITVSEIQRDIGHFFHTPLHSTSPLGVFRWNSATGFGVEKL